MSVPAASPAAAPAPATDDYYAPEPKRQIHISAPTNFLILPPAAAVVGLIIGMSRGGSRARLRFLAENAHRQPKTVQGWYFYTKTRNYRVIFGALRTGGKYAAGLGAAMTIYVALDEGMGWLRERILDPTLTGDDKRTPPNPSRRGWRKGPVHWEDGAVAGGVLATIVGLVSMIMGTGLGATTSLLQIAQDKVAFLRDEEERQKAEAAVPVAAATPSEREAAAALGGAGETTGPSSGVETSNRNTEMLADAAEPPERPRPTSWAARIGWGEKS